jgi:hypothetical protein
LQYYSAAIRRRSGETPILFGPWAPWQSL